MRLSVDRCVHQSQVAAQQVCKIPTYPVALSMTVYCQYGNEIYFDSLNFVNWERHVGKSLLCFEFFPLLNRLIMYRGTVFASIQNEIFMGSGIKSIRVEGCVAVGYIAEIGRASCRERV